MCVKLAPLFEIKKEIPGKTRRRRKAATLERE
jgi:hypothetical protein